MDYSYYSCINRRSCYSGTTAASPIKAYLSGTHVKMTIWHSLAATANTAHINFAFVLKQQKAILLRQQPIRLAQRPADIIRNERKAVINLLSI
jgi:hypothetical protein